MMKGMAKGIGKDEKNEKQDDRKGCKGWRK